MTFTALDHAAVGRPITRLGVSYFPVYLHQRLPAGVAIAAPHSVEIAELDEPSVPTLTVTNLADEPVLLAEGDLLDGGLQCRSVDLSVLVPPRATVDIAVSCVEEGRWSGVRRFRGVTGRSSRRVRRAQSTGDQHAVWEAVASEVVRLGVDSPTCDLGSSSAAQQPGDRLAAAAREMDRSCPLPGQCGVVISHGSRVVAADVFATAGLFAARWPEVVRAALLDAPVAPRGRPSASRALRFLSRLANGAGEEERGLGLGVTRRVSTVDLLGQVLTWERAVICASAFALAA